MDTGFKLPFSNTGRSARMGIACISTVSMSPSGRMIGGSIVTTSEGDLGLSYSSILK